MGSEKKKPHMDTRMDLLDAHQARKPHLGQEQTNTKNEEKIFLSA